MKHYDEKTKLSDINDTPDIVDPHQFTHSDNFIKQESDEYVSLRPSDSLKENVIKIKKSTDITEDSKHILEQFTDENGYICPREKFEKPSPTYQVKKESQESFSNVDTKLMSENPEDIKIDFEEVEPIEFDHLKLEKNECNWCDLNFENERTSKVLEDPVHQTEKKYQSHDCNFRVNEENLLPYCVKSVKLKKNFECDFCDLKYSSKQNLEKHIDTVHFQNCDSYSFRFTTRHVLKSHTDEVHLIKRKHRCESCTYRTSKKSNLQRHIKSIHMKLRDYKCDICNSTFTTNQTLQRHVDSVHLKKWEHQCQFCDYRPFTKFSLQRHLKSVHLHMK